MATAILEKPVLNGALSDRETELVAQVKAHNLTEAEWAQYALLRRKSRDETISPTERAEFLRLIEKSETLNVGRMQSLIELAVLRGVSLDEVMAQLGEEPRQFDDED